MIHHKFFCCAFLLVILSIASFSQAEIILHAPDKVAKGDAFQAVAVSDKPADNFAFFWNGKTYIIKAREVKNGASARYEAQILLPVALDEKAKKLSLGAGIADKNTTLASVHMDIRLYDRERPVQKLTVDKKYVEPPESQKLKIQQDREKVAKALSQTIPERYWDLPMLRPVPGSVTSQFGMKRVFNGQPRSVHRGLDLRGASGTPIKACADGYVALVDNLYFSGNTVYINHGDGVFTAYLHMSEPKVQPGQRISRGDVVGLVGATGRVTGPHLHLSLIVQGQSVDPQSVLEKNKR